MRAHEFLRENDHEQDIKNQLLTILTTLHASQVPTVSVKQIQQSLENAGYFVTNSWISDEAKNITIVKSSTDDEISMDVEKDTSDKDRPISDDEESKKEKNKKIVKNMAKKALKKRG
jgi:sorbitol-specific phosphotransferase system component IIBC